MRAEISGEASAGQPVHKIGVPAALAGDMARRVELADAQAHELGKKTAITVT
jgi:hypothetical protein